MDKCFRDLLGFFCLLPDQQMAIVHDFLEERDFDLAEGHLRTRFPLYVLTISIYNYAKSYYLWGGIEELKYFDREMCGQIKELAEAISDHAWAVKGETPPYFSRENLAKKSIWKVMRMLCRQLADTHSISVTPDQLSLEDLLYKC